MVWFYHNCHKGNCPAPQTIGLEKNSSHPRPPSPPRKIVPHYKISCKNNCSHSSKFLQNSTSSELRRSMHGLRVL